MNTDKPDSSWLDGGDGRIVRRVDEAVQMADADYLNAREALIAQQERTIAELTAPRPFTPDEFWGCSCCQEAVAMFGKRPTILACFCGDQPEDERCECPFCNAVQHADHADDKLRKAEADLRASREREEGGRAALERIAVWSWNTHEGKVMADVAWQALPRALTDAGATSSATTPVPPPDDSGDTP